jgi:hypothetical protein
MVSSVAVLGPFSGGLNTTSDASAIADNEVSECSNLNIDLDGSLVCRTPLVQVPISYNAAGSLTDGSGNPVEDSHGRILVIGQYFLGSTPWLIMCSPGGIMAGKVVERDGVEWLDYVILSKTLESDCAIQLHNVVYILATPNSPSASLIWNGATLTTDTDGPRGSAAVFFKGRLWVAPGAHSSTYPDRAQLRFTDPIPLTGAVDPVWTASNLIPVGQGDGQNLIDLQIVNDNLMLFKNNSTYVYMFDVSPNEGILRKINNNIGTSTQFCTLTHENEVYTYHEGKLYQISNLNFIETTIKLTFKQALSDDGRREKVCLSLIKDIILVRYFDSFYALNLTTKTWSEWQSSNSVLQSTGRILKLETNEVTNKEESYYGGSALRGNRALMKIKAEHTSVDSEKALTSFGVTPEYSAVYEDVPIECRVTTKIYDFGTPHLFKRLMWWGVDTISDGRIVAVAKPARQTLPTTWTVLSLFTWSQLFTWDDLLEATASSTTDFEDPYVLRRKFIKLLKSLRFRRISFSIRFFSNGKTSSEQTLGPARVFSISAIVGAKQTVVKQVE